MLSLTLNNLKGTREETNKENACTGFIETKEYCCKLILFVQGKVAQLFALSMIIFLLANFSE